MSGGSNEAGLCVGQRYSTFDEFKTALKKYELSHNCKWVIKTSCSIVNENKKLLALGDCGPYKNSLVYKNIKYICKFGGAKRIGSSRGIRPQQSTWKIGCPAYLHLIATKDELVVKDFSETHVNHECTVTEVERLPENRKVHPNSQATGDILCAADVKPSVIQPIMTETLSKRLNQCEMANVKCSSKGPPSIPKCKHRGFLNCNQLTVQDIKEFHKAFYSTASKDKQDAFILKYCHINPHAKRKDNLKPSSEGDNISLGYWIPSRSGKKLNVCGNIFLPILDISKQRVIGVLHRYIKENKLSLDEIRDASRKEKNKKKKSVINFLNGAKESESWFTQQNEKGVFSNLSVWKMWDMYNHNVADDLKVTNSYFRKLFKIQLNIATEEQERNEIDDENLLLLVG